MPKRTLAARLLIIVLAVMPARLALADDSSDTSAISGDDRVVLESSVLASPSLLADLESFLHQRNVDVDQLTVERMVGLMIDWYRATPLEASGDRATDMLLFRYGGWSEGCATGFNMSLLRRAGERGTAGITLMFEPSGGGEFDGFATALPNRQLVGQFVAAVHGSPAFQQYGAARPMQVLLEKGGLR